MSRDMRRDFDIPDFDHEKAWKSNLHLIDLLKYWLLLIDPVLYITQKIVLFSEINLFMEQHKQMKQFT